MAEYFIIAQSFAAPFCSDESRKFVEAATAHEAINQFRDSYKHPAGLFAADVYLDANAHAKGEKPLARWLCNLEIERQRLTKDLSSYSYMNHGHGKFEIDGKGHEVDNPKGGRFIAV